MDSMEVQSMGAAPTQIATRNSTRQPTRRRQNRRRGLALTLAWAVLCLLPQTGHADWWSENFEIHGFFTSKLYLRSPNLSFGKEAEISSWRTELNLEMDFRLYESNDLRISGYAIVRPTYDAVYEISDELWGDRARLADFGTQNPGVSEYTNRGSRPPPGVLQAAAAGVGRLGETLAVGGCLRGEFCITNGDTGQLFTGRRSAAVAISTELFFGTVAAPWGPRSSDVEELGGAADIRRFQGYVRNGPVGALVAASLARAGTETAEGRALIERHGDRAPLNFYQLGSLPGNPTSFGDSATFNRYYDINRRESELKLDCFDAAHRECWLREAYIDVEYKNWFLRLGKQQIVWGKTDAFRLQDKINPIDLGYHNIFPELEERRIPQFALDVIYSAGDIGPLQDVSLEFAWIFDRFLPDQPGQCGEPYAFVGVCHFRADVAGHGFFNFGSRVVEEIPWKIRNTEPWLRLEFRIPKPSISFSLSAGWTFQDAGVPNIISGTEYSVHNPNPAALLFLQGLATPGGAVTANIERLAGMAPGTSVFSTGFDPFAHGPDLVGGGPNFDAPDGIRDPIGSLAQANQTLRTAYMNGFEALCGPNSPNTLPLGECITNSGLQFLAFPWTGSEALIRFPRVFTLGGSLDYQIPRIDTVLRIEMAADFDRDIIDTSRFRQVSESDVLQFAIGLDRSTFIPFLNSTRTAFLSFQTFVEHIVDYRDSGRNRGMVPYETQVITTLFMQNYWRNDSLILTSFAAILWKERNFVIGPALRWWYNEHLNFEIGVNVLWGSPREHNIWDVCGGQGTTQGADAGLPLDCLRDPSRFSPGQWTFLYENLVRDDESAYGFGRTGIADRFMRNRDEIWFGMTYQF